MPLATRLHRSDAGGLGDWPKAVEAGVDPGSLTRALPHILAAFLHSRSEG